MNIPELTPFQMKSLEDAARSLSCDYYMLILPNENDVPLRRELLEKNNRETDQLVALGMLHNISLQFARQIAQSILESKRNFRVFRITDMGRLLFQASCSQLVH
jgi:hypothetical protein